MPDNFIHSTHLEEYTENTNTGILYPSKDHSFDNIKTVFANVKYMLGHGALFFALLCLVAVGGMLLGLEQWPRLYQGEWSVTTNMTSEVALTKTDLMQSLREDPSLTQALKREKENFANREQNWFWHLQKTLPTLLWPSVSFNSLANPLTQTEVEARLQSAFALTPIDTNQWQLNLADTNLAFLDNLLKHWPRAMQSALQKKGVLTDVQINARKTPQLSSDLYWQQHARALKWGLILLGCLNLFVTYRWSSSLRLQALQELKMSFPFSVLGILPKQTEHTSPTLINDAFELLRTNISMQRSVFAFSSLTLLWPFDKTGQNEFLTRLAGDFGKTNKKVLVIETTPKSVSPHYACENHKGLSDLHVLLKDVPAQSEKENEIFGKLYEYVFGTQEKFYCMPFGKAEVASEVLFEKYNFRRTLNLLKKHFSLLILNVPQNTDVLKTIPWTTVKDATLIVANYQNNSSVADKDKLKSIACAQRFLLGGILLDVPLDSQPPQILMYERKTA